MAPFLVKNWAGALTNVCIPFTYLRQILQRDNHCGNKPASGGHLLSRNKSHSGRTTGTAKQIWWVGCACVTHRWLTLNPLKDATAPDRLIFGVLEGRGRLARVTVKEMAYRIAAVTRNRFLHPPTPCTHMHANTHCSVHTNTLCHRKQ